MDFQIKNISREYKANNALVLFPIIKCWKDDENRPNFASHENEQNP